MNHSHQILSVQEQATLASLVGRKWISVSGTGMHDPDFAWSSVDLTTDSGFLTLTLLMKVVNIDGEPDEYPCLSVGKWRAGEAPVSEKGNVYFHCRGEIVSDVMLMEEVLTCASADEVRFVNTSHTAVAVKVGEVWISMVRSSHFSDSFDVHRSNSLDEIPLPQTLNEWEADLMNHFTIAREWISVS